MSDGWGSKYAGTHKSQTAKKKASGWGSRFAGDDTTEQPKKKHGHGLHGIPHWLGEKTSLAAHDIKSIPGGIVQLGEAEYGAVKKSVEHPWVSGTHDPNYVGNTKEGKKLDALITGMGKGVVTSFKHPLRDPFQTVLNASAVVSGGSSAAARAGAVARTGKIGAALAKPAVAPRLLKVGDEQVALHASKNPAVRVAQGVYDKTLQRAIDKNPEGRAAAHATKRVGGAMDETARYRQRMRDVPGQLLAKSAKKLAPTGKRVPGSGANRFQRVEQAALELVSVNTSAEDAAAYHTAQAAKQSARIDELTALKANGEFKPKHAAELAQLGKAMPRNTAVAKLYGRVAERGLLTKNEHGDVVVNAADHPKLAAADTALARVQGLGDTILTKHGVRGEAALTERVNAPARIRAGATYETPTAAKAGVPSQSLLKARARVTRLEALHERALTRTGAKAKPYPNVHTRTGYRIQRLTTAPEAALKRQHTEVPPGPKTPGVPSAMPPKGRANAITDHLGAALSVARDELASLEQAAARRVKPTGIVGGRGARPGRGFVSYATDEPRAPKNAAAASTAPVVGEARSPITNKTFTGQGIEHGKVPNDITGQAVRHFHQIVRFVNTSERRNQAIRSGSAARRTSRDVLVRIPGEDHAKIPAAVEQILGRKKLTHDDVEGLHAALNAYREDLIPGLRDKFSADKQVGIGVSAPEGHVWVDRHVLGDLAKPAPGPRGRIARTVDSVNAAVTAATVYFKIGHIGTRVLTNAATNIIQGSAGPREIARSVDLWKQLSHEDRLRALAAAGQHGFDAMPHEGQNIAGRVAGHGAQWWAKHADAPFRFNSLAYEARKAGFDTPTKFQGMLDKLENPEGLDAAQTAKVDWVAKRANRAQIAYDRLNRFERQYITRAVWFYPWIKGASMFAGHTLSEHPYKAAAMGTAGEQGRETQQRQLGDVPSYEGGLLRLGPGGPRPTVTDFSTFSPFATPADILEVASGHGQPSEFFNPALAGANTLANKLNPYGGPSSNVPADVLAATAGPTSEFQLAEALAHRGDNQSNRMFNKTPGSVLLRALVGPAMPRRINLAAAHRAAARDRAGGR